MSYHLICCRFGNLSFYCSTPLRVDEKKTVMWRTFLNFPLIWCISSNIDGISKNPSYLTIGYPSRALQRRRILTEYWAWKYLQGRHAISLEQNHKFIEHQIRPKLTSNWINPIKFDLKTSDKTKLVFVFNQSRAQTFLNPFILQDAFPYVSSLPKIAVALLCWPCSLISYSDGCNTADG